MNVKASVNKSKRDLNLSMLVFGLGVVERDMLMGWLRLLLRLGIYGFS
jgi:hypothetical protein